MRRMPHITGPDGLCDYCKRPPDEQECAIRLRGTLNIYLKWLDSMSSDPIAVAVDVVARFHGVDAGVVRYSSSRGMLSMRNMAIAVALEVGAPKPDVAKHFGVTEKHVSRVVHGVYVSTLRQLTARAHEILSRRPQ